MYVCNAVVRRTNDVLFPLFFHSAISIDPGSRLGWKELNRRKKGAIKGKEPALRKDTEYENSNI